ncbi:hypothetical protein LSAT2_029283 [Lamellibrachia satsuma]|nr:hypothetical protein LSAT2_029283 [Lamellibrachia satsuma]
MAVLFLVFLSCICNCVAATAEQEHVRELTDKDFTTFTDSQRVRVVYFYDSRLDKTVARRWNNFLPVFDKSCKLLTIYNVECAKVDCALYPVDDFCARPSVHDVVYTFKRGKEFIELTLDSMFDLDSIISNILQIVLLQQVPILQNVQNRRETEKRNVGKYDIVYSYHSVIGTYEHRIMMELAHAYSNKYQFALTTESGSVKGLRGYEPSDRVAFWVLHCKKATDKDKPCLVTRYRDNVDLISLARFLHVIDVKPVVTLPGGDHTLYIQNDMHMAAVLADKINIEELTMETEALAQKYRGLVGFFVVDLSRFDVTKLGLNEDVQVSTVVLKLRGETMWETMPDSETPESFLDSKLQTTVKPRDQRSEEITEQTTEYEDTSPIETEDDKVAEAAKVARNRRLDEKHVLRLTEETFVAETKKRDCLVVMFYFIFDARSTSSLFSYLEASRLLAAESLSPLATVECHDDMDICVSQNVTSYPTIKVYKKGKKPVEYTGPRGAKEITSFVKLFLTNVPIKLNTFEEAKLFLDGKIPKGIDSATDVSVLGLFTKISNAEKKAFRIAAKKLRGQFLFGETTGEVAEAIAKTIPNRLGLPKVVVYKRNDEFRPIQVCPPLTSWKEVAQCARDGSLLMFPELTAASFPKLFAESLPFLILFTNGHNNDIYRKLGNLAASANVPNVVYCWMDLDAPDTLAMKILMSYHDNHIPNTPSLSMVDYKKGAIYHYNKWSYERDILVPWIEAVEGGEINPSRDLPVGEWKAPMEGYNYLKLEDEGTTQLNDQSVANEYGLGFDSEGNYLNKQTDEESGTSPELEAAEKEIHEELLRLSRFYPKRGGGSHVDKTEKAHQEHTEL